jgi:squalene cyclase
MISFAALLFVTASSAADDKKPDKPGKAPMDEAIERALSYLASSQSAEGSWSARYTRNPAISALAVMAFLSAGHVPGEGKYGEVVKRGVDYVLRQQQPNGLFASEGYQEMYQHGICTLMLAEVVGMTEAKKSDEVKSKLERAVAIILRAQRSSGYHKGGWRYRIVGDDGDISVTGWQLMALRAAKNVGCDVPPERIEWAVEFINKCHDPYSGGYRYMPGSQLTVACTGTSVLALELCGKEYHRSPNALKAGAYLLKNELRRNSPHYFYGVYYCSQAMFQLGDNYWNTFRGKLHDQLLTSQNSNGSWTGRANDDAQTGPNYCTAMAVLALAVEYRFLPIYQRDEQPTEEKK